MHHNDAPDPRTDIADLYVFQKPDDPSKSILILNVNPEASTRADAFDPEASYEFKIDTDGDFEAEIAFHVSFMTLDDGQQIATVYRLTGMAAPDRRARPLSNMRPSPSRARRVSPPKGDTGSSPVCGASHSLPTRTGFKTTCNGQVGMVGREKIYSASCWKRQTARWVLIPRSAYGAGRWNWCTAR